MEIVTSYSERNRSVHFVSAPSRGEWEVLLNDDVVNLFQVMFPYPREVNGGSNPRALFRTVSRT